METLLLQIGFKSFAVISIFFFICAITERIGAWTEHSKGESNDSLSLEEFIAIRKAYVNKITQSTKFFLVSVVALIATVTFYYLINFNI